MSTIRVRHVSDGEELVLAEELFEARLGLGLDPRAETFERRRKALTDPQPRPSPARVGGRPLLLRRIKAHDWSF